MKREYKINLIGQKFGRLTVIEKVGTRKKPCGKTIMIWKCKCDCGNITEANTSALRSGEKSSCGCLRKERKPKSGKKTNDNQIRNIKNYDTGEYLQAICSEHGLSRSRLYNIWQAMKTRCYNKNHKFYKDYGGRGIKICKEWQHDFMSFREWAVNNGYKDSLTIDRIDVNGNYEPSNCRWVTMSVQNKNKRAKK